MNSVWWLDQWQPRMTVKRKYFLTYAGSNNTIIDSESFKILSDMLKYKGNMPTYY